MGYPGAKGGVVWWRAGSDRLRMLVAPGDVPEVRESVPKRVAAPKF